MTSPLTARRRPARTPADGRQAHTEDVTSVLGALRSPRPLAKGKNVTIIGLNEASAERHGRLAGHLAGGH